MGQSQTYEYNTVAAHALDKLQGEIADNVATGSKILYFAKKQGNFKPVKSGGPQFRVSLRTALQSAKPIGSYGTVNINPVDGDTAAWFAWGTLAVGLSYSEHEEFQTAEATVEDIVTARREQAETALYEGFSKALLQGLGAVDSTSITSEYPGDDDSTFILPLAKLVSKLPTGSSTVGGIDQSTNAFWQNRYTQSSATSYALLLQELRYLRRKCGRGPGGANAFPDVHLCDEQMLGLYEAALASKHQNPSYEMADIPFTQTAFFKKPVMDDELFPDFYSASTTITYGTWVMLNSKYYGFAYDGKNSFKATPPVRPAGQLIEASIMRVRGTLWTNNRRKHGVLHKVVLSTAA